MKVVAFIPIKMNNERLPGKNIMPLNGKPLCEYLFSTMGKVSNLDEAYVYCSDEKIKEYMPESLAFLRRDPGLDDSQVKGLEIIDAFVRDVDADIYVISHVTSPFLTARSIEIAVDKVKNEGYDSAFSAQRLQGYCWYKNTPVNYDLQDIVTTQNLEPVFLETGGFFIFKKEVFTKLHRRIGENAYIHEVGLVEAVDIDTREEFEFAQLVGRANILLGRKEL